MTTKHQTFSKTDKNEMKGSFERIRFKLSTGPNRRRVLIIF